MTVSRPVRTLLAAFVLLAAASIAAAQTAVQTPARKQAPLAVAPLPSATERVPVDPRIIIGRLENGLRYYIRRNPRPAKRAELRLVVNAGSVLEDDDQLGLAHVVEHMAFNGTKHFAGQEITGFMESIGMQFGPSLNAFTTFDDTTFLLTVPTDRKEILEKAFLIMEDWAHNLTFDGREIDKERGVIVEEWRQGRGAAARLQDQLFPDRAEGIALRGAQPDRHEGVARHLLARPAQAVLPGLVPHGPDGRGRRRRFRSARHRAHDQGAVRVHPGAGWTQAEAGLPGARPPRHPLRDRDRPGAAGRVADDLQEAADPRAGDGPLLPRAHHRPPVRGDVQRAAQRAEPARGRAVHRRRRGSGHLRADGGSGDALGDDPARPDRSSTRSARDRGGAGRTPRVHRHGVRAREAEPAARLRSGARRERQGRVGPARGGVHPELPDRRIAPGDRVGARDAPEVPPGHHAQGGQRAGDGVERRQQPRRGDLGPQPARPGHPDGSRSGAHRRIGVAGRGDRLRGHRS